jgi:ribosomal peptide maturation radical SAM protein 1
MKARVLLVAMPWNRADYPSVQIGLLKGHLLRQGISVRAAYPYLDLERRLGGDLYLRLADKLHPVLGESFFAAMLAGDSDLESSGERLLLDSEELEGAEIATVRSNVRLFMEDFLDDNRWEDVDLAGFTCSFNQVYASLLAARELKKRFPRIRIVLGGSAMRGRAGRSYFEANGFIDYLVSGPGEEAIVRLAGELPKERMFIETAEFTPNGPPDYEEFFFGSTRSPRPAVVLNASRGCNFGRCAFCAQNEGTGYVRRDPGKVLEDVASTTRRYGTKRVEFSDTCFPFEFLDGDWPARMGSTGVRCFAQMRTFLLSSQAAAMRQAGFDEVQVGVESFHEGTLRRMNKPSGLISNIQCLRVAYAADINVGYNLILDFPGTTARDLEEMATLLPALYHLQPPTALVPFALQHGSVVHRFPTRFGVTGVRPHRFYRAVSSDFSEGRLMPMFYDFDAVGPPREWLERIDELCRIWVTAYNEKRPALAWTRDGGSILIHDRRDKAISSTYVIPEAVATALELLDQPCKLTDLQGRLGDETRLGECLAFLRDRRLVVDDGVQFLALPVEDGPRSLGPPDELDSYFTPSSSRGQTC